MELYYAPGACSIGIHVLLEEIGKPYTLHKLDLAKREQYGAHFARINPKAKVPTLVRDDGLVLTEFPAIATWLARCNRHKHLLPEDLDGQVRALEAIDYIVATIHMQGFSRVFRPANFTPNDAEHEAVKARGREIYQRGFALLEQTLDRKDYLVGGFSIADAALFYVAFWAVERVHEQLPLNCAAHYQRMKRRAAVQHVLKVEGF
jgi:glutathione S-transferase